MTMERLVYSLSPPASIFSGLYLDWCRLFKERLPHGITGDAGRFKQILEDERSQAETCSCVRTRGLCHSGTMLWFCAVNNVT